MPSLMSTIRRRGRWSTAVLRRVRGCCAISSIARGWRAPCLPRRDGRTPSTRATLSIIRRPAPRQRRNHQRSFDKTFLRNAVLWTITGQRCGKSQFLNRCAGSSPSAKLEMRVERDVSMGQRLTSKKSRAQLSSCSEVSVVPVVSVVANALSACGST